MQNQWISAWFGIVFPCSSRIVYFNALWYQTNHSFHVRLLVETPAIRMGTEVVQ